MICKYLEVKVDYSAGIPVKTYKCHHPVLEAQRGYQVVDPGNTCSAAVMAFEHGS